MKMKSYERCRERVVKEINGVLQVSQCKFRRKYNGYCKIHAAQHGVHQTSGKRRVSKSKLVVPAAGNA